MASSPSSSAQAARVRLGARLRALRVSAGLTGRAFAAAAAWRSAANVTKIEKGQYAITADTVRLWCRVCEASDELTAELLAEQSHVAEAWMTHMELNKGGLKARQERLRGIYWDVAVQRVYQTRVVPGLLQTADMIAFLLDRVRIDQHVEIDDVAEAVAARLARQECLKRPDARWLFILEEDVLWYRPGSVETHKRQLAHLLEMMRRPTVFLGIIPRDIDRRGVITGESFTMDDESLVAVELTSGEVNITSPGEVRLYLEMWARLESIAVYGQQARTLIRKALDSLDGLQSGRVVTDPAVLEMLGEHAVLASDEAVVWIPARMRQVILDALTGYEEGRQGHGAPNFEEMLAGARRTAIHLEMRDFYGPDEGFRAWLNGGQARLSDDGGRWDRLIGDAVSRGVNVRRVRIISRPASKYSRWLHLTTGENIAAGEDVRWLWRPDALGLFLPHADLWMFDHRLVAFNHNDGEGEHVPGYTYVTDPREIPPIVAAVEMAWERATPHEKFDIDG